MKQRLFIFLAISHLAFMGTAQYSGTTYANAKTSKSAKFICIYDGVTGLVTEGAKGGLLIDLMKEFASFVSKKEGITISIEYVRQKDFEQLFGEIRSGKGGVFGLSNISITEERMKSYSFSPAYLNNISVLITNTNSPTLESMDNLPETFKGKYAIAVTGSTYINRLQSIKKDYFPDLRIETKASTDEVLAAVLADNNSFTVVDLIYYLGSSNRNAFKRHPAGDFADDKLGILMPKANDWAPLLEEFMSSGFLKSAEYRTLVLDNLGKASLRMIE